MGHGVEFDPCVWLSLLLIDVMVDEYTGFDLFQGSFRLLFFFSDVGTKQQTPVQSLNQNDNAL